MKKALFVFVLAVLLVGSVFAGDWSFELVNGSSLYKEASMDPYSFITQLGLVKIPGESLKLRYTVDPTPDDGKDDITYMDFDPNLETDTLIRGKISAGINLAHFTFTSDRLPKIEGQINLKAYFNTLLKYGGANNLMGLDGSYLFSTEVKVADKVALRLGLHHLSGHYGDEVLEAVREENHFTETETASYFTVDGKTYKVYDVTQFVRDNELLASVSVDCKYNLRPYAQFALPRKSCWTRPFIHNSLGQVQTTEHLAWGEGVLSDQDARRTVLAESEDSLKEGVNYKAYRLNVGCEWSYAREKWGVTAGLDIQANQDGMTMHQIGSFNKDNKWEFEYTLGATFDLFNVIQDRTLSISAAYHKGRVPLLNFYYVNTNMFYIGAEIR